MGIAGLWSTWGHEQGQPINGFTMLTINADEHPLMRQFHKPDDDKRMVVILPRGRWKEWLLGQPSTMSTAMRAGFLKGYPAERLSTHIG